MARPKRTGYEAIPPEFEISDSLRVYIQSQLDAAYDKGFAEGKAVGISKQFKKELERAAQQWREQAEEAAQLIRQGVHKLGVDQYWDD